MADNLCDHSSPKNLLPPIIDLWHRHWFIHPKIWYRNRYQVRYGMLVNEKEFIHFFVIIRTYISITVMVQSIYVSITIIEFVRIYTNVYVHRFLYNVLLLLYESTVLGQQIITKILYVQMYFWVSLVQFIGTKSICSSIIIQLPLLFPFGNIDVTEFFFLKFSSILLRFLDITQAARSVFSFFSVIVLMSTF